MLRLVGPAAALMTAIVFSGGCATFGTYETAQTTARGKTGYGVAITPFHATADSSGIGLSVLPLPELSGKLGVTDRFELGARWGCGPGMTLTGKYLLARGHTDRAFATYGSVYGMGAGGISLWMYDVSPRIIISREDAGAFQFSANAGLDFAGVTAGVGEESASGSVVSITAGLGLPFRLGEQRDIRFMPEISLSFPLVSNYRAEGSGGAQKLIGNIAANLGVGVAYVP